MRTNPASWRRAAATWCAAGIALALWADGAWTESRPGRERGDLAVQSVELHEVAGPAGLPRLFVRADVRNVADTPRREPFDIVAVGGEKLDRVLGRCRAEELAARATVRCELFIEPPPGRSGPIVAVRLDRRAFELDRWDRRRRNDQAVARPAAKTGEGSLRIADFDVLPRVLRGMGEVSFRYTVEHGHLVWVLVEGEPPRLLSGHPGDGLLAGQGRLKIRESGPITLVARDSAGRFAYRTIPITNTFRPHRPWSPTSGDDRGSIVAARALDPETPDDPVDPVVLDVLERRIAALGWAPEGSPDPFAPRRDKSKGNVLNPAAR